MISTYIAVTILAGIWAFGDIVSVKTKAYISATFVALVLLMVLVWTNVIPKDIVQQTQLVGLASMSIPMILLHMGTTMELKAFVKEWKTILICLGALLGLLVGMFVVGRLLIGDTLALTATPVLFGGLVAAMIMGQALTPLGFESAVTFAYIIMVCQFFVGIPIASFLLNKFAKNIINNNNIDSLKEITTEKDNANNMSKKKKLFPPIKDKYQTDFVLIFKMSVFSLLAVYLGQFTEMIHIHTYIITVLIGFICSHLGILDKNILIKSRSYGIVMFSLMMYISVVILQFATPQMVLQLLGPMLIAFLVGVPSILLGAYLTSKLLKFDTSLGMAIASTTLMGFPFTVILPQESAKAIGRSEEEKKILADYMVPKMVVGGLIAFSTVSGLLASVLTGLL